MAVCWTTQRLQYYLVELMIEIDLFLGSFFWKLWRHFSSPSHSLLSSSPLQLRNAIAEDNYNFVNNNNNNNNIILLSLANIIGETIVLYLFFCLYKTKKINSFSKCNINNSDFPLFLSFSVSVDLMECSGRCYQHFTNSICARRVTLILIICICYR